MNAQMIPATQAAVRASCMEIPRGDCDLCAMIGARCVTAMNGR
jgi:hypothetical protein